MNQYKMDTSKIATKMDDIGISPYKINPSYGFEEEKDLTDNEEESYIADAL